MLVILCSRFVVRTLRKLESGAQRADGGGLLGLKLQSARTGRADSTPLSLLPQSAVVGSVMDQGTTRAVYEETSRIGGEGHHC